MEDKDVQIRGYRVRLRSTCSHRERKPRGLHIARTHHHTAQDRFGSQVGRTIRWRREEMQIMESERHPIPRFRADLSDLYERDRPELTHLARRSPQHLSVVRRIVRMSIANFENLASNAVRRSRARRRDACGTSHHRLEYLASSTAGRVEIEALDEGKEEQVAVAPERGAISAVFSRHFSAAQFDGVVARSREGSMLEVR